MTKIAVDGKLTLDKAGARGKRNGAWSEVDLEAFLKDYEPYF